MTTNDLGFKAFGLSPAILTAVERVGYETPSPIQSATIPLLLEGRDMVGQAQTGTGKTAAFALPFLSGIEVAVKATQLLVLAPTRELAIQVAEAMQGYASGLKGFHVLPIYGGQAIETQLRALKRGVHVVVGTPGRVMDHMRRGTLKLDQLKGLVLDEADEMLRMGFIDDVKWILERTPKERQTALFSATMPDAIRRIAEKHLNNPEHISVKVKTATADTINQRSWLVAGMHKLDALTRILEAEPFDAMLVFVRTKTSTVALAEKLEARGFAAAPLNGDIAQNQRERTVQRLKKGKLDIIVATDVAARGLDVERISHVVNFDIPYDTEAYIHRIGRTGRAGRTGEAIIFVSHRERRMLRTIEKAIGRKIHSMQLPTVAEVNLRRVSRFKERIGEVLTQGDLSFYRGLVEEFVDETNVDPMDLAAALARMSRGDRALLLSEPKNREQAHITDHGPKQKRRDRQSPPDHRESARAGRGESLPHGPRDRNSGFTRYRIEVGYIHGVKPGNIVGAIANEAGMDHTDIGHIDIQHDHSFVDLPSGMPAEVFRILQRTRIRNRALRISTPHGAAHGQERPFKKSFSPGGKNKKGKTFRGRKRGFSKRPR